MDFPAHDFAAEDVHDQVEIEEHPRDGPGQPCNVPGPDLAGRTRLVAGWWFAPDRRLGPAAMLLLPIAAQDAVEAGFRGQITPLIGQFWHDLAWLKAGKFL